MFACSDTECLLFFLSLMFPQTCLGRVRRGKKFFSTIFPTSNHDHHHITLYQAISPKLTNIYSLGTTTDCTTVILFLHTAKIISCFVPTVCTVQWLPNKKAKYQKCTQTRIHKMYGSYCRRHHRSTYERKKIKKRNESFLSHLFTIAPTTCEKSFLIFPVYLNR